MKNTSLAELKIHLDSLGLREGMNVSIHSKLLYFGRIEGGLEGLYRSIREIIGTEATIVVPGYTFDIPPDQVFDPKKTKPQNMGSFSNYFLTKKNVVRTISPIHSHFVDGPLQEKLLKSNYKISFGPNSIFQSMQEAGFRLLLLGCSFSEGATFLHHLEACNEVPYRKWVNFRRKITTAVGEIENINVLYYARKKDSKVIENFNLIQDKLVSKNVCKKVKFHSGISYLMDMSECKREVEKLMKINPNILVKESDET